MSDSNPPGLKELISHYETERPEELRQLLPEKYVELPPEYYSLKTFGVTALAAADKFLPLTTKNPDERAYPSLLVWLSAAQLARPYGVPTFFVTPELVAAALRTELNDDLILAELCWPFPFLLLMLPRGSVRHAIEGDARFLAPFKVEAGTQVCNHRHRVRYQQPMDAISFVSVSDASLYSNTVYLFPGRTLREANAECFDYIHTGISQEWAASSDSVEVASSTQFTKTLFQLSVVLLLIMTAHPELIEPGVFLKRVKSKHPGGEARNWWTPNFIGRHYQTEIRSDNPHDEPGYHTRAHWVRGHLRSQPYGPRHELRKIIWIPPYKTGAPNA